MFLKIGPDQPVRPIQSEKMTKTRKPTIQPCKLQTCTVESVMSSFKIFPNYTVYFTKTTPFFSFFPNQANLFYSCLTLHASHSLSLLGSLSRSLTSAISISLTIQCHISPSVSADLVCLTVLSLSLSLS